MKISVIIPAHNEEKIVRETIEKVYKVLRKGKNPFEIVAVNDNSDDRTGEIMEKLSKRYKRIKSVHKKTRSKGPTGLGSAIRFGFKHSSGDIVIPLMGDLSDDPRDLPKLVKKIFEGYDVVCGSRFIEGSSLVNYPKIKMICNRFYNRLFTFLFCLPVNDISNAFKAYRRKVLIAVKPESKGFEITSEIVLKAHINNFKTTEVPVSWHGRKRNGKSKFGSFISPTFIFFKLPGIGFSYAKLSLILWFKFLLSRILD
jgi:glycosyltransferase involved in cell wall biosynthesis